MNLIIAPSVLSMDYSRMGEQMSELNESQAGAIHFDVMDGHFVPNLSFGPAILSGMREMTAKMLDVHLMVTDPDYFAERFIAAGADLINFHVEACRDTEGLALIDKIHAAGKQAGITLKPKTPVSAAVPYLDKADLVLIMTVEPGFGGQKFMPEMLDKVRFLAIWRDKHQRAFHIEVDGGVDDKTIIGAKQAGADMFVAGSYVFKHPDGIIRAVASLL